MKCKTLHMQGEILETVSHCSHCMDQHSQLQSQKSMKQKWHMQQNLKCMLLPQYYPWLACFVSNVCPNHVHRWMTQQRNSCRSSMKWLMQGKFNMWFCLTIQGFEQICYALELGDEEEQHRGEWGLCRPSKVWRLLARLSRTWPRRTNPCREKRVGNHYISATNST